MMTAVIPAAADALLEARSARMLAFWHPVARVRDVPASRPVRVTVAGRAMAVFRTGRESFGAIEDRCAHRRMKLSAGRVADGRVICPYHGWSFGPDGQGESPGAPRLRACAVSYECAVSAGAVWVRSREAVQPLPDMPVSGWAFAGSEFRSVAAPVQLVIDNFSEIEHTSVTHPHFGLDPRAMADASVQFDATAESVTVRNDGPAKMPALDTRLMVPVLRGDRFHSDYTFTFDPPRAAVTHYWTDPRSGRERLVKYRVIHYFVPEDDRHTCIATFAYLSVSWPVVRHLAAYLGPIFRRKLRQTLEEDAFLLENLADQSTSIEGMKLGRFDPILGMTRQRLQRVYYGEERDGSARSCP
jgi:phenylpropionate dioxygenase-like ring-hydroxylating dioxygenase large terminal subunit